MRDFLFVNCQHGKHDWKFIGGTNAECHKDCGCSVPVHQCTACGDYDYGKNEEAEQVRKECAEQYGKPEERF